VSISSPGDTLLREYDFTLDLGWQDDSCNVVVFIQDYTTKEILQSAVSRVYDLVIGVEEREGRHVAPRLALLPGYPNPFTDRTRISYAIPSSGRVGLRIYDSAGNLVRTLLSGTETAGKHEEYWDGKDNLGRDMASGVYFSMLSFQGDTRTDKISLIR